MLQGASAWVQDKLGGRTPLHIACLHGHAAVAKALLDGVNDARCVGFCLALLPWPAAIAIEFAPCTVMPSQASDPSF